MAAAAARIPANVAETLGGNMAARRKSSDNNAVLDQAMLKTKGEAPKREVGREIEVNLEPVTYSGVSSVFSDEHQPELISSPVVTRLPDGGAKNGGPAPEQHKAVPTSVPSGWAPPGWEALEKPLPFPIEGDAAVGAAAQAKEPAWLTLLGEQLRLERARNAKLQGELDEARASLHAAEIDATRASARLEGAEALVEQLKKENARLAK